MLRTRQEILASAPTWGGTRVGEQTTDASETALEFTLPGENLEIALGALGQLDARVVSTTIDVEAEQIDRTTTTAEDPRSSDAQKAAEARQVRLRVEVSEATPAGAGAALQLVMGIFSVIGMAATAVWILNWWRRRGDGLPSSDRPRHRNIDRVDLRGDPPTQETPRVPPQW